MIACLDSMYHPYNNITNKTVTWWWSKRARHDIRNTAIYKPLNKTLLIISCSTCYCDPMANTFWILLVIAVASTEVALAVYPPCDPPRRPVYGGYSPHKTNYSIGSRIYFHCDKGYTLHGATWTDCKWDKQPYWVNPPPVCTCKLRDLFEIN